MLVHLLEQVLPIKQLVKYLLPGFWGGLEGCRDEQVESLPSQGACSVTGVARHEQEQGRTDPRGNPGP